MDHSTRSSFDRIAKFLSGNMPPEEAARFEEWLEEDPARRQLLEEALLVWQAGEEESLPDFDKDVDGAWKQVAPHVQRNQTETKPPIVRPLFRRWLSVAAAAIVLLAVGTWIWLSQPGSEAGMVAYATATGETLLIALPDGSRVWLNERSTLRHPEDFSTRSLQLEGEAFFEVQRLEDSPFVVTSGGARTEVLGTAFHIRAYPEEGQVELTVESGKVAFARETAPEARLELEAGASAIFGEASNRLQLVKSRIADADSWRTGKLEFDEHATLEMVRLSFERYYHIRLEAEDSSVWHCHFKGIFEQAPPEEVAESIAFSLNLELVRTDSVYTFLGSGCSGR
jgi:ferric-dicitrate binding protein FerR (iron transport regulator)